MKHINTCLFVALIGCIGCNNSTNANSQVSQPISQPLPDDGGNNAEGEGENIVEVEFCQQKSLLNAWPAQNPGSTINQDLFDLTGIQRDEKVLDELILGHGFSLEKRISKVTVKNESDKLTFCVFNDYLSLNHREKLIRFPLGMTVLDTFISSGAWTLPTAKMVDLIYVQSSIRLSPQPIPPSSSMGTTQTIVDHSNKINPNLYDNLAFVAGHKKDIVISNRLINRPDRIAIYGWHKKNGQPIQPLSTVHHKNYADYSHGVRLVYKNVLLNDEVVSLGQILKDPNTANLISHEGVLDQALIQKYY